MDISAAPGAGWRSCRRTSSCRTAARLRRVLDLRLRGAHSRGVPGHLASPVSLLAFGGPAWYHTSSLGHFTNSLHFWSVQLFFVFMVIHLWGKFWMAAWRGRRAMTWITGVVAFLASIGTAFTGYLVQTNFDSQWISFEAKDGLNAVGIGAFFNVTNLGQMLLLHACLLPLGRRGRSSVWHVLLVRRRGVVPPIDAVATPIRPDVREPEVRVMTRAESQGAPTSPPGVERPLAPLRHRQGRRHRYRRGQHPDGPAGGPVQLPRRAAADLQGLGDSAPTTSMPPRSRSWPAPAGPPATARRTTPPATGLPSGRWPRRIGSASRTRSTRPTTSSSRRCAPNSSPPM